MQLVAIPLPLLRANLCYSFRQAVGRGKLWGYEKQRANVRYWPYPLRLKRASPTLSAV